MSTRTYSGFRVSVAPTTSAVTLAEARAQLRNEDLNIDDALITSLITAAEQAIETRYMLAISAQTIIEYHTEFDTEIVLRNYPINTVTGIIYKDAAGATQTATLANFNTGIKNYRAVLTAKTGTTLPDTEIGNPNAVAITYTAGFTVTPLLIKQAMLLMISDFYENRENPARTFTTAAEKLLEPFYPY